MLVCGGDDKQRGTIVTNDLLGRLDPKRFVVVHWDGWPNPTPINVASLRKAK